MRPAAGSRAAPLKCCDGQFNNGVAKRDQLRSDYAQLVTQLSPREREVYQLLLQGHESKQIALLLSISPSTAEKHRLAVVRKMQTENVVQLLIQKFEATGTLSDRSNVSTPQTKAA